jgi:hypothetical protein
MQNIEVQASDKQFLRPIAKNGYEIPENIDHFQFAQALLANFASVDEELRDELSYMILAGGIIDKHKLTTEQLENLLFIVLDEEHLFYKIGEVDTDSVFMRSFSNLIIAAILYIAAREEWLSESTIQQTKEALFRYTREEKDWRGYVEGKGWAHAMAHLADALDECARHPHMSVSDHEEIMNVVRDLTRVSTPLYHEEDTRLAMVAYHIIACKEVNDAFLKHWLEGCYLRRDPHVTTWRRATNIKNFLRSLYFLLLWDNLALSALDQISTLLKRLDDPYMESEETIS